MLQAEDGIRDDLVTGVQTCALPISIASTRLATNVARFAAEAALFQVVSGTPAPPTISTVFTPAACAAAVAACANRGPFTASISNVRSEERRVGKECRSREWPYASSRRRHTR